MAFLSASCNYFTSLKQLFLVVIHERSKTAKDDGKVHRGLDSSRSFHYVMFQRGIQISVRWEDDQVKQFTSVKFIYKVPVHNTAFHKGAIQNTNKSIKRSSSKTSSHKTNAFKKITNIRAFY